MNKLLVAAGAGLLCSGPVLGAIESYTDQAPTAGLEPYRRAAGFGSGIAAADFDADGDVDLFLPTGPGQANRLYVNQGNATFLEQAAAFGLADTQTARSALWYDFDGDGDLDLAVGRDSYAVPFDRAQTLLTLFEQTPLGFVDVSARVGLTTRVINIDAGSTVGRVHVGGLSAGDVNGDGLPDLFVAIWQAPARLYLSGDFSVPAGGGDGDGEGGGYGIASGVAASGTGGHWQALFHDFDGDSNTDIFVNIDFANNELALGNGAGGFTDFAAAAGVASAWNEMGLAAGDVDNDGDLDLYVTNIFGWNDQPRQNNLWINTTVGGAVSFGESAAAAGVADTGWGWGTTLFDADNDGDLDLAATNGYCQPGTCAQEHEFDQSRLFENDGSGLAFADVSAAAGFDDTDIGAALLSADFDRDGDLELVQTYVNAAGDGAVRLLDNEIINHGITVRPRGYPGNTHAIGSKVVIEINGKQQTRWITSGISFMAQEPAEAHFGLGDATVADWVEVIWPTGQRSRVYDVAAGAVATLDFGQLFASGFE